MRWAQFTWKQCADTVINHNTDLCIKCSGGGSLVFHCLVLGSIPAGNAGSGSQSVFETAQLVLSVSAFLEKLWRGMKKGFSIGRDKVVDVYHDAEHFDVTKDAKN